MAASKSFLLSFVNISAHWTGAMFTSTPILRQFSLTISAMVLEAGRAGVDHQSNCAGPSTPPDFLRRTPSGPSLQPASSRSRRAASRS